MPIWRKQRRQRQKRRRPPHRLQRRRQLRRNRLHTRIKNFLFLATLALCPSVRAEVPPDATARFIAGLPVPGTPLEKLTTEPEWIRHAAAFDREWGRFDEAQGGKIRDWAAHAFGETFTSERPVFYMFSGPDFLYANAVFPNAGTYILCGTEPVGGVPDVESLPAGVFAPALANLRRALESSLNWSFFITKHMKTDLQQKQLSGTLPVLYVFLARSGCTIESVTQVKLDVSGNFAAEGSKKTTKGVKIVFQGRAGREQTLYYFTTDLADWSMNANPWFLKFCETQGRGVSLLKAASYLMHGNHFNRVREFLLSQSDLIVEDDSGIPFRFLESDKWSVQCYGRYVGPIGIFKKFPQPDLTKAYAADTPAPLDYSFGYQWRPSRSSLLVVTPKKTVGVLSQ
ncbi:MAG TPA: hypothetical protein VGG94_00290, partial [Chthoniobacterales bacterium]